MWRLGGGWAVPPLLRGFASKRLSRNSAVDEEFLPKVAIVGRPNVGKSALFNKLVRRVVAMVYDTPNSHVTRDYKEGVARLGDLAFRVVDTSGLEPGQGAHTIQGRATELTAAMLGNMDLALLVVDAKDGLVPHDADLARWLRRYFTTDNVIVVANKAENQRARLGMSQTVAEAYRLGFGEPVAVSAATGEGMADLFVALQPRIDALVQQRREAAAHLFGGTTDGGAAVDASSSSSGSSSDSGVGSSSTPRKGISGRVSMSLRRARGLLAATRGSAVAAGAGAGVGGGAAGHGGAVPPAGEGGGIVRMAIMGLPNVGKSTLLNSLLQEKRSLTGPEPGLTRDAVRVTTALGGVAVELVDTAGWIGHTQGPKFDDIGGAVADLSRREGARALASVHVAVLVIDCERALKTQMVLAARELSLATLILEEGKALVVAANKVDLLPPDQRHEYITTLRRRLSERFTEAGQLPIVEISAQAGTGVEELAAVVLRTHAAWNRRVTTGHLNRFVRKLGTGLTGTGGTAAAVARVKYLTQLKARPPSFGVFVSGTLTVDPAFEKYLAQQIRTSLGFQGVPIRLWFRYKEKRRERAARLRKDTEAASRAAQALERRTGRSEAVTASLKPRPQDFFGDGSAGLGTAPPHRQRLLPKQAGRVRGPLQGRDGGTGRAEGAVGGTVGGTSGPAEAAAVGGRSADAAAASQPQQKMSAEALLRSMQQKPEVLRTAPLPSPTTPAAAPAPPALKLSQQLQRWAQHGAQGRPGGLLSALGGRAAPGSRAPGEPPGESWENRHDSAGQGSGSVGATGRGGGAGDGGSRAGRGGTAAAGSPRGASPAAYLRQLARKPSSALLGVIKGGGGAAKAQHQRQSAKR